MANRSPLGTVGTPGTPGRHHRGSTTSLHHRRLHRTHHCRPSSPYRRSWGWAMRAAAVQEAPPSLPRRSSRSEAVATAVLTSRVRCAAIEAPGAITACIAAMDVGDSSSGVYGGTWPTSAATEGSVWWTWPGEISAKHADIGSASMST